jgi:hypothetical protein
MLVRGEAGEELPDPHREAVAADDRDSEHYLAGDRDSGGVRAGGRDLQERAAGYEIAGGRSC